MSFRSYVEYPLAVLAAMLFAGHATAVTCSNGLTAENLTNSVSSWGPNPVDEYGNAGTVMWTSTESTQDAFTITGSTSACLKGGTYEGTLTAAKDANTYYQCPGVSGWEEHGYPNDGSPCYPYHQGGSPSGLAPSNGFESIIERAIAQNQGDGISLLSGAGDVWIAESWIRYVHDDGVEHDYCREDHSVTVVDSFLEKVFMLFAWDLRNGETPCTVRASASWSIERNIAELHRFAHSYKERAGHGGVFKDDGTGANPMLASFKDNVILLGPVIGSGQVIFPPVGWFAYPSLQCSGNTYLWRGTEATVPVVPTSLPTGCITVVAKDDAETDAQFLARDLTELGGQSYNDVVAAWKAAYFPTPTGGCGMGPELALVLPVVGWLRRRLGRNT